MFELTFTFYVKKRCDAFFAQIKNSNLIDINRELPEGIAVLGVAEPEIGTHALQVRIQLANMNMLPLLHKASAVPGFLKDFQDNTDKSRYVETILNKQLI